jgi:hypothetical protein
MFQLDLKEWGNLKSQIGSSSSGPAMRSQSVIAKSQKSGIRSQTVSASRRNVTAVPNAITEPGVAKLSSVLSSPRAGEVNIAIKRTFVPVRRLMESNRELARKIEAMEDKYDEQFAVVFDAIKKLIAEDQSRKTPPKRRIGFID